MEQETWTRLREEICSYEREKSKVIKTRRMYAKRSQRSRTVLKIHFVFGVMKFNVLILFYEFHFFKIRIYGLKPSRTYHLSGLVRAYGLKFVRFRRSGCVELVE